MNSYKIKSILIITLMICCFFSANLWGQMLPQPQPTFLARVMTLPTNQPYASFWHPNDLLAWNSGTDPDAAFNRSNTPLQDRFLNSATQVNANARANEGQIIPLDIFGGTSGNPSQGSLDINYFAFNYWQYVQVLVFWGGSAGEGLILAPNPGVIDAAHRNGVPVLGTVFFPPTAYGGDIQWVYDFLQKSGDTFPVADKLIEVANYYGFDGYFINQETAGGNSTTAADMVAFMKYYQANSSLELMWYDAMTESGSISWQEQLNSSNDAFFQDGTTLVSEYMFLDFGWNTGDLTTSRTNAQNLGRSEYELYAGVDVQANGYITYVNWNAVFPDGQPHVTSLGLYVPSWTYHSASDVSDFYTRANRFWIGVNRDPSNTSTTSSWKGLAHYIPANSPVNDVPFVTNFCTGQGYSFYVNGQELSTQDWNNIGLQDVLPTWRWIVESSGTKLYPEIDFSDAYYGGNCIKISGDLTADNLIKLYKTELSVSSTTNLEIAFKTGSSGTATNMQVALSFTDSPSSFVYLPIGNTTSADWNTKTISLSGYSGRTIAVIGLQFQSSATSNYEMKVGRIGVIEGSVDTPSAPSNAFVDNKVEDITDQANVRLKWTHSPSTTYYYNVYRRNPDNSLTYLGGTANNAYFIAAVNRVGTETSCTLEVEAVGMEFGHSTHATTSFNWNSSTLPAQATRPNPADGAPNVSISPELSWLRGDGAVSHDVYFGTSNPPAFIGNQTADNYTPATLDAGTTYYWRIDEKNTAGTTTGTVWSFTTYASGATKNDRTNESGGTITARGDNDGSGEGMDEAFDNNVNSKWLDFSGTTWIQYQFGNNNQYAITEYSLTSANDAEERDPKDWTLKGSNDGSNWTDLDVRENEDFPNRFQTRKFWINNTTAYEYYRLEITNNSGTITQVAEIEFSDYTGGSSGNWIQLAYDDFESGWGNYTSGGGDCVLYTYGTYAHQGNNAANIQDNSGTASSFYLTNGIDVHTADYTEIEVDFWFYAVSMDNNEDFWVQYFDGSTWQTVATYAAGTDFNNDAFYHKQVYIYESNYNFPTGMKIRFMCDASNNRDDVYIDEVKISAQTGLEKTRDGNAEEFTILLPDGYALDQNYPNPFNPETRIKYSVPKASNVSISIFNSFGQKVIELVNEIKEAGYYTVIWNGKDKNGISVSSGVYFYQLVTPEYRQMRKMLYVK